MRTIVLVVFLLALAPGLARAEIKVVATVPALAAVAREVGGRFVSVKTLTRANQDPHFVDARPSLALDLNRANLILVVGLNLEAGWLPTLLTGARNGDIQPGSRGYLDCAQFVDLLEVHDQPVDRSMGDIHPGGNPHYLNEPRAAAAVARGIAARFGELDPQHREQFQAQLAAFGKKLEAARTGWESRLAPFKGTPVVAYHRTWVYLSRWVGLEEVEFLEPKPGIPPNPAHIAHLLVSARQRKVRAILQEDYYPDATSRLVAEKIPVPLVKVPGGPDFQGGQSYVDYMARVVDILEKGLRAP